MTTKAKTLVDRVLSELTRHKNIEGDAIRKADDVNRLLDFSHVEREYDRLLNLPDPSMRRISIDRFEHEFGRRYRNLIELAKMSDKIDPDFLDYWHQSSNKNRSFIARVCHRPIYPCWHRKLAA